MATIVAFHAHPDDEVLLTGGTLALLAAAGHRVVLVGATDGSMGAAGDAVSVRRLAELRDSAALLGVDTVHCLGHADSGHGPLLYPDPPDRTRFARTDVDVVGAELAAILTRERADVLIGYDRSGGYGHRDHCQVHDVARRAATVHGDVALIEATRPRQPTAALLRIARRLHLPVGYDAQHWYTPRREITHRVRVGTVVDRKQAALAAHRSQREGNGRAARLHRVLVALPVAVVRVCRRREWFVAVADAGVHPAVRELRAVLEPR